MTQETSHRANPRAGAGEFGALLRAARAARGLNLDAVATITRIPARTLLRLEAGDVCDDIGEVFVRGFVRSYARVVHADESLAIRLLEDALTAARGPVAPPPPVPVGEEADGLEGRRRFGLALFVVMLIVIVSLTLSLLGHRGPSVDRGVSHRGVAAARLLA